MHRLTNEELELLLRIGAQEPKFVEFCKKQREDCRTMLEQGGSDVVRGHAQTYGKLVELLTLRGEPTR